jgi:CDP-4-dehydro-6-deoxyglucose reductase
MVAERTGFAPIKSLIEHAVALDWPRPIRLVWCAEPGGHYLQNYCRSLEDAFDEFSFTLLATRPGDDGSRVVESFQAQRGSDIYAAVEPVFARALAAFADELDTRLFVYA